MSEGRNSNRIWFLFTVILGPVIIGIVLLYFEYRTPFFQRASTGSTVIPTESTSSDLVTKGAGSFTVRASETVTVSQSSAKTLFDGSLTIAVVEVDTVFADTVTAVVNTPGYPEFMIEAQQVGYIVPYKSDTNYEVQVLAIHLGEQFGTIPPAATFSVVKEESGILDSTTTLEPPPFQESLESETNSPTPVFIDSSHTLSITQASGASLFDGLLTIAVVEVDSISASVTAVVNSPGYPELGIESQKVGYKVIYESDKKYEVQVLTIHPGERFGTIPPAVTFRVTKFTQ